MAERSRESRGRAPAGQTRERVLDFVRRRVGEGLPPTVREVQRALGFRAVETAREHLARLVAEGRLAKEAGTARGYRLPHDSPTRLVPLLGRVPAGPLSEALESPDGHVRVELRPAGARAHARGGELFALRVQGDSMSGAAILDGDLVIVRRQERAREGEIVVARVGGEATVKRLRLRDGRVVLAPENPAYAPIAVESPEDFAVLGVVVEVRRYCGAASDTHPPAEGSPEAPEPA